MKLEEIQAIFDGVRGTAFVGLDTETAVKLKGGKKNPLQGKVTKKTVGSNVIVFFGGISLYENMVKSQMIKEGKDPTEFQLKPRTWGKRIGETPFIEHGDKHYLECVFKHSGKTSYYVNGVETPKDEIGGLELSGKDNETSQGGISEKIILRTYSLDSIKSIRFKGEWSE